MRAPPNLSPPRRFRLRGARQLARPRDTGRSDLPGLPECVNVHAAPRRIPLSLDRSPNREMHEGLEHHSIDVSEGARLRIGLDDAAERSLKPGPSSIRRRLHELG
jgi:hypothetical protein